MLISAGPLEAYLQMSQAILRLLRVLTKALPGPEWRRNGVTPGSVCDTHFYAHQRRSAQTILFLFPAPPPQIRKLDSVTTWLLLVLRQFH